MRGIGPGTILGGRYCLRRRLEVGRDLEHWSADDTTLQRDVALTIVDADHPNRAGILDAARRAAGVEDTRLVRILDVGTKDGNSYFVEEGLDGAESLATILQRGVLPAEETRRIVGEVASGLETARHRGLHHLRLTPHHVLRSRDGAIKVSGVAVAAAIEDAQEPDPAAASRRDAVCVVAVAYAGLTTRWPLDERVFGVEPAPRVVGGVAAPSEIASGVPGDLDALCRMTLNEDTGPLTPGDFASQIAPWSRAPVHRVDVERTVVLDLANPANDVITYQVPTQNVTRTEPSSRPAQTGPYADPQAPETAPSAGERAVAAGATATRAVDTVVSEAGAAVGVVVGKVGSFARAAADKASAASAARPDVDVDEMTLHEALSPRSQDAPETPLPMLPAWSAEAPGRDQPKVVVLIVAAFLALSLLVGYCGFRGIGDEINLPTASPRRTAAVTVPPPVTAAPPEATASAPTGGEPIAVLSATGFDPEGDGQEKNTQAPRVYDGSTSTAWTSEGYGSANFGGLGKKGLGVRLDLGQPTSVNQVTIDLGLGPVNVTVYAAIKDSLDGATVIGAANDATGQIKLRANGVMPQTQYVIIWFTTLAPDDGRFRASISEIALS